jgi:hypothetical protein
LVQGDLPAGRQGVRVRFLLEVPSPSFKERVRVRFNKT